MTALKNTAMPQSIPRLARERGFTLIELMIAVAIVAILAAVAMPSYTEYIMRSHRSNARTTLVGAAQWMERAATALGSYPPAVSVTGGVMSVEGGRYTVTVVTAPAGSSPSSFTFTAAPLPGTKQAEDKCGSLAIDQAGRKTVSGASLTAAECWSR
jgi:type IV pilus assembly protein PilE